ncbi:MAG: nucleotidyltransferase domain-containing protein [Candidatus Eisenbacteria bacterium]|nr:nucleotidyltransferase domain-containing protein [Candidatus Eisenbacteria bacterium]
MLETLYITKSRIRQDLLSIFFSNPSQRYYLRQLERILGYSAGNIRRELLRFQRDNLFVTHRVGSLLYYSLDTRHPLFKELKAIVSKTVGVEGAARKTLSSFKNIRLAFIYGSFASGREKATSDIDLMIIGNPNISVLNEKIAELEKKLRREINPTIYSLQEYRAKKRVASGFIEEVLTAPKIMLVGKEDEL